ncbi:MAG: GH3 auxin-responsive promoter family protein, partial [Prevotella sp.]|nr:GH3 auxin-responsive promoter family protein [Prevotella sp.]
MSITSIAQKLYFSRRQRELQEHINHGADLQRKVLESLLCRADDTEYGRRYAFSAISKYETFAHDVPLNDYESLKQDI